MSRSSSSDRQPFSNSLFHTVDRVRIHYRTWVPGDKRSAGNILLIHGFGGSTFSWRNLGPALASMGFLAVAVDLPGFGHSSRETAAEMSDRRWVELMWGLLDHIETTAEIGHFPWILVGHSVGGRALVGMSNERPERVKRIVFIDAALYGSPAALSLLGVPAVKWLAGRWLRLQLLTPEGITRLLASAYGREPEPEEVEGYLDPLLQPGTVAVLLRFGSALPEIAPGDLSRMEKPALIVWGERDSWLNVKTALRIFNDLPTAEVFIVPEAGHVPQETHPEAVLRRLGEFLAP